MPDIQNKKIVKNNEAAFMAAFAVFIDQLVAYLNEDVHADAVKSYIQECNSISDHFSVKWLPIFEQLYKSDCKDIVSWSRIFEKATFHQKEELMIFKPFGDREIIFIDKEKIINNDFERLFKRSLKRYGIFQGADSKLGRSSRLPNEGLHQDKKYALLIPKDYLENIVLVNTDIDRRASYGMTTALKKQIELNFAENGGKKGYIDENN